MVNGELNGAHEYIAVDDFWVILTRQKLEFKLMYVTFAKDDYELLSQQ